MIRMPARATSQPGTGSFHSCSIAKVMAKAVVAWSGPPGDPKCFNASARLPVAEKVA